METVLVIGAARSGIAVSKLLLKNGYHVVLTDSNAIKEKTELESMGIEVFDGGHPDSLKEKKYAFIVKNPGIPYRVPFVHYFVEQNAKIYTEIEVAYRYAKNFNYAAVTGTDGKTTVTTLLYEMLNRQKKSLVAGNIEYLGGFLPHIPVPTPILVAIIVVILATLFLNKTATKLYIESVGINPRASRLFGLNSTKIIFITYAACGLCAGIAGMIATSRITSIDANNVGNLMELDAILAVALGGNSLAGGKFSVAGSVIGAITIQALSTTLYAMKVTGDQLPLYKAIVVIIIVTLQSPEFKKYLNRIKAKRAAKTAGEKVA